MGLIQSALQDRRLKYHLRGRVEWPMLKGLMETYGLLLSSTENQPTGVCAIFYFYAGSLPPNISALHFYCATAGDLSLSQVL